MDKLLVICDSEKLYGKRLYEYMLKRQQAYCNVKLFTSVESMVESLRGRHIDVLMIDELSYAGFIKSKDAANVKAGTIKILSAKRPGPDLIAEECIYKYQPAKELLSTIAKECGFEVNEPHYQAESKKKTNSVSTTPQFMEIKLKLKKAVQEKLLLSDDTSDEEVYRIIDECIKEKSHGKHIPSDVKTELKTAIFNSIRRLDVLQEFIDDDSVSEIMVNGESSIFVEREGRLICTGKAFDSRETLYDIIQKIVAGANRTVNMSSPIVDARLKDGSRVNVVLDPISLSGPILTIRRFPKEAMSAEKLISLGAVNEEIVTFLKNLVVAGYNILISGSTGAGKTTFLNVLSGFIPSDERIITIEDSAELQLIGIDNLVRLETRNANVEGCKEITIRDLIKTALRMRPDRIVVGEVRGEEAVDMVQAMTVGQEGALSTIHANSAEDALSRLEMLFMMNMEMPIQALRRQIASGVDIVIQLSRLKDKSRKLMEIIEVADMQDNMIITNPLYEYKRGQFTKLNELQNTYKLEKAGLYELQNL